MSHFISYYAECHYAEFRYAECHYAECRYAECRYAECRSAIVSPSKKIEKKQDNLIDFSIEIIVKT